MESAVQKQHRREVTGGLCCSTVMRSHFPEGGELVITAKTAKLEVIVNGTSGISSMLQMEK